MKIVVMVDNSAGNEAVGGMWTETYLFDGNKTLWNVFDTIFPNDRKDYNIRNNIRMQIAEEKETT